MNLKEERLSRGWTQKEAADAVGIPRPVYSLLETGKLLPSPEITESLQRVYTRGFSGLFPEYDNLLADVNLSAQNAAFCEETAKVITAIPAGKENAITREKLAEVTGLADRPLRRRIAEARRAGVLIINAQDGSGYYLAESTEDVKRQYRQDRARALSILARLKTARQVLAAAGEEV